MSAKFRQSVVFKKSSPVLFSIIVLALICFWASFGRANEGANSEAEKARMPDITRILRDLEYVPGGHERQKLDLYLPQQGEGSAALPLIVWVHGGAWLRANAGKYNIDPNHIGVWGASAGGHLVALLGTTGDVNDFDKGPNLQFSSKVQAVCDFFGPTDLTKMSAFESIMDHDAPDAPEAKLIGGPVQENKEACKRANPITYISKNDPPFLICHGDKDNLVPINQSVLLYEALKKAGVDVTFHTVEGGGHGFRDPEVDKMVLEFFTKHLKGTEETPSR